MNKIFKHTLEISELRNSQSLKEIENYNENHLVNKSFSFNIEGENMKFSIIFSTSKGVYIIDTRNNISKQILQGKFYGIIKHNEYFFFSRLGTIGDRNFPNNEKVSEICYSKIINYEITNLNIGIYGIPAELHQIENLNETLIFPHTGYNQILSLSFENILKSSTPLKIDSCKSIELKLNEHSHLNSIFFKNNNLFLIAHNYTMKTNKMSDLVVYNTLTNEQEIIELNAHSAHNIYVTQSNEIMYCDSNNKKLVKNNKAIFKSDKLLRGLSITKNNIFVGGSDISFDDYKRFSSNSSVYILNMDGDLRTELKFSDIGNIYEIRQLEDKEFSIIQNEL